MGIYIVNEGSFGNNNGSISFFDPAKKTIYNGIFEAANGRPLGDIVQSFAVVSDTLGYIVVNNSSKVEIVGLRNFKARTEPVPIIYPRYFMQVNDEKGYLTAGSLQGRVYVFNLGSGQKTDSIEVGYGPETMLLKDDLAYIANSGGWGSDSTISVINTLTDHVVDTIKVGLVPMDMAFDIDDNIWVYCKGYTNYNDIETDARLQKINRATNQIIWQTVVGKALDYSATPAKCAGSKDGAFIYYLRPDGVYEINTSDPVKNNSPLISGSFYGLEVNPADGNIYVFESSFTGNGIMKIFDDSGKQLAEGVVGIGPNGAAFNL